MDADLIRKRTAIRRVLPLTIISISITALLVLFFVITQKLNLLREAPGDNLTWALSQVEIEVLLLSEEASEAAQKPDSALKDVRRRFDNLYSRVSGIGQSAVFKPMLGDQIFTSQLAKIKTHLDELIPLIDGEDAALRRALSGLGEDLTGVRQEAHDLALTGIRLRSQSSDAEREGFSQLLWIAAVITLTLIGFLALMLFVQLRQQRTHRKISGEIERANTRLQSTFEVSLDAIVVADDQGIILDFNEAAEKVFGYARDEALGAQMAELIIPGHLRDAHYAGMERFNKTREPRLVGQGRIEITALRKSGEEFPVEISIGQAQDHRGTIFISYLRDITDRLAAEKDLKQARDEALLAEKAKSNFLAVMSHEMRTPLNGIFGTIELLKKTRLTKPQKEYLDIAKKSGDILLLHVNDVLDVTRIDAGELEFSEDVFDLAQFFRDVITTNEPSAVAQGNRLLLDVSDLPEAAALMDEQRLRQVAFNLISNALKFTNNGTVTLSAGTRETPEGLRLEFEVKDTGVGIPKEDQAKVFERFFTQEKSYDRLASGAGLGLTICKQIVDKMGGDIALQSEPGEGTTFSVSVPLKLTDQSPEAHVSAETGTERSELKGHHVLLVEDNEINRLIIREMLENEGLRVSEAHNGLEAVKAAQKARYAAILMDVSMPKMNGVDATKKIREEENPNDKTPILGLTAHALEEERKSFLKAGMNTCLNKPVTQDELAGALSDALFGGTAPGAQEVHQSREAVLDKDIFGNLQKILKADKLTKLIEKFESEINALIDDLPNHLSSEDPEPLRQRCHKCIGSAGMMGALSYQRDLRALEQAARSGDHKGAKAAALAVVENWPRTMTALTSAV